MRIRQYLNVGVSIFIFSLLLVGNTSLTRVAMSSDNDDPETTEIVVKLNPAAASTIEDINTAYGTTMLETLVGSAGIYRLRVATTTNAEDLAKSMEDDARLLYVEPNYSSDAPEGNPRHIGGWGGPNETETPGQYAVNMLGLLDAHEHRQGNGVTVAILDTGVQFDHPDLVDAWTSARYDFIDDDNDPTDVADGSDDDGDGFVDEAYGHGTHIAGIINLVAPDAQIMPLRVLEADGHGNIFVIAEAVQFALDNGADVINLSLGSANESELLEDILKDVVEGHNVVVVAAAGNLGDSSEQFPASLDEVLAVTAINEQSQKSGFANFGEWIDVSAPGEAILSTFPVSKQASWSGTSMAVPFVAGHAALVRSAVPSMSAIEVSAYIRVSAQSVDAQNQGLQGQLGAGRINVGGSIQAICNDDGTCQAPDLTGQIILESRAIVESQPENKRAGTWVIGGNTFVADSSTVFRLDDGPLEVGTCADVEYRNTSPLTALEIRSREQNKCSEEPLPTSQPTTQPTMQPTSQPISDPAPTATESATLVASPQSTLNPTSNPTLNPTRAETSTATPIPTSTVAPTSTQLADGTPTAASTTATASPETPISASATPNITTTVTTTNVGHESNLFLPLLIR